MGQLDVKSLEIYTFLALVLNRDSFYPIIQSSLLNSTNAGAKTTSPINTVNFALNMTNQASGVDEGLYVLKHLLNERFPPGSRRGHPTAGHRPVGSALHHQLPQVPLLLLHLLLLPLLLGIHQGTVSVRLFALCLVTHHCMQLLVCSLHSSSTSPTQE